MHYVYKGMFAGVLSAVALSILLMIITESGFLPALDFIALISAVTGIGTGGAWLIHFILAAAMGGLFAWLDPDLPGDSLRQRGMIFAGVSWFVMVALLMPLAGHGFLGLEHGLLLPLAALGLHLLFGSVMGGTYGWLLLQGMPVRYRQVR